MDKPRRIVVAGVAFLAAAALVAFLVGRAPQTAIVPADDVLRVGLVGLGDVSTLDPAQANATAPIVALWQLHRRLVSPGNDGAVLPDLAQSWKSASDLREWRFELDAMATFWADQGGKETDVRPADVKFSIERALRTPGYAASLLDEVEGVREFIAGLDTEVKGIVADATGLVFRLRTPLAFLPQRLSAGFFSVVPSGTPTEEAAPRGAGPYRLSSWDRGAQTLEIIWRGSTDARTTSKSFRRIRVQALTSEAAAFEEVRNGGLDWILGSSALGLLVESREATSTVAITRIAAGDIKLVALNLETKPFAGRPELGRLLNQSVDRVAMARFVGGGVPILGPVPGKAATNCLSSGAWAVTSLGSDAISFELLTLPDREHQQIALALKSQWEAKGHTVKVTVAAADFFDRVVKGNFQAAVGYFGPFTQSAEQYLWLYRSAAIPVPNVMRYRSHGFEEAWVEYIGQATEAEQKRHLQLLVEQLCRDSPVVWLLQVPLVVASRPAIRADFVGAIPVRFVKP